MLFMDDDAGPAWAEDSWTPGPAGCIDSIAATAYMMNDAVQKAIHAVKPDFCWSFCNQRPSWKYQRTVQDETKEVYPFLLGRISVLIYNGDMDGACLFFFFFFWVCQARPWTGPLFTASLFISHSLPLFLFLSFLFFFKTACLGRTTWAGSPL